MGYRIFRDSAGTEWQTWDVLPRLADRRGEDRRATVTAAPTVERRRLPERRVRPGGRTLLTTGLGNGWLCFETQVEKRRLAPIPADWERCSRQRLEQYCRAAKKAVTSARLIAKQNRSDERL